MRAVFVGLAATAGALSIIYCLWRIATGRAFRTLDPWPARSWEQAPYWLVRFHRWYARRFGLRLP